MNTIYNFAFVKINDRDLLENTLLLINRSRHHSVNYKRVILTVPRKEWVAIIVDSNDPDHYLMRNLSGRLETTALEFGINGVRLFYRVHENGTTTSAYESHVGLWVLQQLRTLITSGDVMSLDLAEPVGRLVLRRFHEHQRSRAWTQPTANQDIPHNIADYYQGDANNLAPFYIMGTAHNYIQEVLSPEFEPDTAFERLVNSLNLPYLSEDSVELPLDAGDDDTQPTTNKQVIKGYDILRPGTWSDDRNLPSGWAVIKNTAWQKEASSA